MVYRGTASPACVPCRKAKKRCGLERPTCARCIRLAIACFGYRPSPEFCIRDESEAVILRATGRTRRPPTTSRHCSSRSALDGGSGISFNIMSASRSNVTPCAHPTSEYQSEMDASRSLYISTASTTSCGSRLTPPALTPLLSHDVKTVVLSSFAKDFSSGRAGFWKVVEAYITQPGTDPCLDLAVRACGIVALRTHTRDLSLRSSARAAYAQAARLLNENLSDGNKCSTDQTLLTVIVLGYYEVCLPAPEES